MKKEELHSEWKRDMYHNYLIIRGKEEGRVSFQEKMLEHNKIEGILSFQVYSIDNQIQFHYEVTGYQALSSISEKVPLRLSQVTMLLNHLLSVLKEAKTYLLDTMDFVLLPEYTFIHLPDYKPGLCYYPGYRMSLQEQLTAFFEYLMGCVDYEDKDAVLFVYSLYMKSKEDNITIQELKSFLNFQKESDRLDFCSEDIEGTQPGQLDRIKGQHNDRELHQSNAPIKQLPGKKECYKGKKEKKYKESLANLSKRGSFQHKMTSLSTDVKERILGKGGEIGTSRKQDNQRKELYQNGNLKKETKSSSCQKETKEVYQYPFIKEKLEQEEEILYYPILWYVLFSVLFTICIGVFLYAYQKGFLFQPLNKRIDRLKLVSILSVMGIILGYGYRKIFSKDRKQSRIITKTTYQMPDKEDLFPSLASAGNNSLAEHNSRGYTKENDSNQELLCNHTWYSNEPAMIHREEVSSSINSREIYAGEEECTMLLTSPVKESDLLIPLEPLKYGMIELKEYPFFIGTAKNNLGYNLTNTTVSRYHAKLDKQENRFLLTDLNSTNGTFVNGRKLIENENFEIKQGDAISFANISFIFQCVNICNIE